ncbi:MAG TPA: hypothetical protein PKA02_03830 [Candidatus Saccharibacteria bacterium]|nr:hypothetical protein [Candidatus Saccharibacteria bacterium]
MSSFAIPLGEQVLPYDLGSSAEVTQAMRALQTQGGVLFHNIPDHLRDDGSADPSAWAAGVASIFLPALVEIVPELGGESYGIQARRHTHKADTPLGVHYDPRYRDPIFWGETRGDASAEFRFSGPITGDRQRHYWFEASPGTMWVLAGPRLLGGRQRILHELGSPSFNSSVEVDRTITMGSFIAPKK